MLLINHYQFHGRNNLTALLSEDDGRTYPYTLLLDPRNEVSYPDAVEAEDGSIYIIYDRERGAFKQSIKQACACAREIRMAKITEADILQGKLVSEGSYLQRVVNKLGAPPALDFNPYLPTVELDSAAPHILPKYLSALNVSPRWNIGNITNTDFIAAT